MLACVSLLRGLPFQSARALRPPALLLPPGGRPVAVFGHEALVTGPRLDERAVHREVVLAEQLALVGQLHHLGEEALHDGVFEQPISVLGEHRVIPYSVVDGQADEPAVQQVVANLLHQLTLAAHREQHLDEHGAQQLLRGNGGSTAVSIDLVEQAIEAGKRLVDQLADGAQRMVRRHEVFQLGHREQRLLHSVRSTHRSCSCRCIAAQGISNLAFATQELRGRISTAC